MTTHARRVDADFSASKDAPDAAADVRALAKIVADGSCRAEHMRLVRWRNLRRLFARRWREIGPSVTATIRAEIGARLGPKGCCVGYDDDSILVLCPPPGDAALGRIDEDFSDAVGARLAGALRAPDVIEVLRPVDAAGGLTFESRAPAAADKPTGTLVLGDALFRYYPLWDVGDGSVFCYLCEASWNVGDGEGLPEQALAAQFEDPKRLLALDLETLSKASGELDKGLDRYQLAKFLIPVHYRTIADPAAAETYTRFCHKRMWAIHEFALFEIVNPPRAATTAELTAVIERLEPFAAGVMLRVDPGFDRFAAVPADRVLSVGIDLRYDRRSDDELIADIREFAAGARAHGLRGHLHGLHTVGSSVIAGCAGVDFIGSDAIAEGVDDWQPENATGKPAALLKTLAARAKLDRGG